MKRILVVVLFLAVGTLLIGGCAGTKVGTFERYETTVTSEQVPANKPLRFGDDPGFIPPPMASKQIAIGGTGNAVLTVDGAEVVARCAFRNLTKGQRVEVRMSDSGDWVVVSVR